MISQFAMGPGEVGDLGLSVEHMVLAVRVQKAPPTLLAQTLPHKLQALKRTSGPRGKAQDSSMVIHTLPGQELMDLWQLSPVGVTGTGPKLQESEGFLLYAYLARPTIFAQREGLTVVTLNFPSHWINHPFPPNLPTEQNIHIFFAQRQFVN